MLMFSLICQTCRTAVKIAFLTIYKKTARSKLYRSINPRVMYRTFIYLFDFIFKFWWKFCDWSENQNHGYVMHLRISL